MLGFLKEEEVEGFVETRVLRNRGKKGEDFEQEMRSVVSRVF